MRNFKTWLEQHQEDLIIVVLHIVAWGLYLSFINLTFLGNRFSTEFSVWYIFSVAVIDMSVFYYLYVVGIPKLLMNRKTGLLFGLILLILAIYPFLVFLMNTALAHFFPTDITPIAALEKARFWTAYGVRVLSCLFVVMMAGIGKFTFDWFKNLRIRRELENQNLTSELAFLKSQINPHFLFNTLNNIHTLAYKKADGAPEAIMKLSELMRYMIYDSNTDLVPLNKELQYLQSFIDLQELRFKAKGIVSFKVEGDVSEKHIAPLILFPFVENAFKHGAQLNNADAIQISLKINDDLVYQVRNEFVGSNNKQQKDRVGGIGLGNIRRRLELIYPSGFGLEVAQTAQHFNIKLTIRNHG
ncbi:sensor histidine kinase [Roseivirga sp.]|uniref:sensor histidine kinase n=1 Tax=Roseivirga sp. TaxID=1964215 RepID=UPI002B269BBF|nr:histidine kinase [Roseivirga sp.]